MLEGNLSGVYTNIISKGKTDLEIATKTDESIGIAGIYNSIYFENGTVKANSELLVISLDNYDRCFSFLWTNDGARIFEGIGYLMNQNQIAVNYWPL